MLRNFINKIYPQILEKLLSIFDISSGTIVGLWSVVFLIGCAYSIYRNHDISMPTAMIFSTVISAFAGHKIVTVWKSSGSQQVQDKPVEKNLDCQSDDK